ncbi:hypothetical protein Tco_1495499, partial [Tanacetum coccineum]
MDPLVNTLSNGRFVCRRVVTPIVDSVEHCENRGVTDWYQEPKIINHVDDLLEVEPNPPDLALAIPEHALVDENEEPEEEEEFEDEEEFKEEEPQEEEEDIVHEVGELSTATFLREDGDRLLPSFMRRDINSLFGRITSLTRQFCGHEMAHALVKKKGNAKDKYY